MYQEIARNMSTWVIFVSLAVILLAAFYGDPPTANP